MENEQVVNQEQEIAEEKTYTQEEVDKMLQAYGDKRVSQALKSQERKAAKEKELLGLDDKENTLKQQSEQIQQLQEQLKQYETEHTRNTIVQLLGNHGIPVTFAEYMSIPEDNAKAIEYVNEFEKIFKDAVTEEVKKRLAGHTPNATNKTQGPDFKKMSLTQKQELYSKNPDLYNVMSRQ